MGIKFFENVKSFYIIGIGGVSMSALAEFLLKKGYRVKGSDISFNERTKRLKDMGVEIYNVQRGENVSDEEVVLFTSAVTDENEELVAAKRADKLIFSRSEFLNLIGKNFAHTVYVAGSHGKTTTTCMLAHIFAAADKSFCAHIGGDDLEFGNFVYRGDDFFISEACEYRKNLNCLRGETVVLLNSDADHMECYKNKEELEATFYAFLSSAENKVACRNSGLPFLPSGVVDYAYDKGCYYAENISSEGEIYSFDIIERDEFLCRVTLNLVGYHNVLNALAACAAARIYGIGGEEIKRGLEAFRGVKRRFERIGSFHGADVVCDYAHHPREIAAVFSAAKKISKGKIFLIFQPHTYSRTKYLMRDFVVALSSAENLLIYQTFPAREEFDERGSALRLAENIELARYTESPTGVRTFLQSAEEGDLVLGLGAGDIYEIMKEVVGLRKEND